MLQTEAGFGNGGSLTAHLESFQLPKNCDCGGAHQKTNKQPRSPVEKSSPAENGPDQTRPNLAHVNPPVHSAAMARSKDNPDARNVCAIHPFIHPYITLGEVGALTR